MGLRDIGASLPPGFRFYPSDEELVCYYLYKKITNEEEALEGTLVEIDLHTCEPWQLPEVAKVNGKEWYFFSFRDRKYGRGERANRATTHGFWKATGKDRIIINPKIGEVMGMRKTLVFYRNRAPNGIKTSWIMHEFRIQNPRFPPKEDWVLCRVFDKSKCDKITMDITQINRVSDMVQPASTSSSLCSPSSYIQFPPAVDASKLPYWNNNINNDNNAEEVAGRFKLNDVDHHDYSTIQQMKFEIEDIIQNDFIPFEYFIG